MPVQLYIGLVAEGSTDIRFMAPILLKTFHELAINCRTEIQIEDVVEFSKPHGLGFTDQMRVVSENAINRGISVLCIHADADSPTAENTINSKFTPFLEAVSLKPDLNFRPEFVPVIPVQMTEAWMLADPVALSEITGLPEATFRTDALSGSPERHANPKRILEEVLREAFGNKRRKSNLAKLSSYYQIAGQKTSLPMLRRLSSFNAFEQQATLALQRLGLMDV